MNQRNTKEKIFIYSRGALLLFLLCGIFYFGLPLAYSAEWLLITEHENGNSVFYDKDSVKDLSENRLRAWVKFKYSEDEAQQVQKKMKLEKQPDHLLVEYGIDCSSEKSKALSSFYYAESGNVLANFDFSDATNWDSIAPETVMDSLYRLICHNSQKVE